MTDFTVHSRNTAPDAARPLLDDAERKFGFVPNVLGVLAEAPVALEAYLNLSRQLGQTAFTPLEQQAILITTAVSNGCEYCVAAHSTVADGLRPKAGVVEALRAGVTVPDPRLEALRRYTALLLRTKGFVSESELERFLQAGYTRAQALEVLVGVAMKVISNYANHLAHTPLDDAFAKRAWRRTDSAA